MKSPAKGRFLLVACTSLESDILVYRVALEALRIARTDENFHVYILIFGNRVDDEGVVYRAIPPNENITFLIRKKVRFIGRPFFSEYAQEFSHYVGQIRPHKIISFGFLGAWITSQGMAYYRAEGGWLSPRVNVRLFSTAWMESLILLRKNSPNALRSFKKYEARLIESDVFSFVVANRSHMSIRFENVPLLHYSMKDHANVIRGIPISTGVKRFPVEEFSEASRERILGHFGISDGEELWYIRETEDGMDDPETMVEVVRGALKIGGSRIVAAYTPTGRLKAALTPIAARTGRVSVFNKYEEELVPLVLAGMYADQVISVRRAAVEDAKLTIPPHVSVSFGAGGNIFDLGTLPSIETVLSVDSVEEPKALKVEEDPLPQGVEVLEGGRV